MPYIRVINKSSHNVEFLKQYAKKLQPYFSLVQKDKYPFIVEVLDKKDFYDRSSFDITTNKLTLKINMKKQSPEEIAWVLAHEFAHFLTVNNKELLETNLGAEYEALIKILMEKYSMDESKVQEIFHDFLPAEVFANGFATLVIGKFYKRHPFSNAEKYIK